MALQCFVLWHLLFMCVAVWQVIGSYHRPMVFNVIHYGAIPDGFTDNSKAFSKAWNDGCNRKHGRARILVPQGTFLVRSLKLSGPCKAPIFFTIKGVLKASPDQDMIFTDRWITFQHVSGLTVNGGGVLDGQGEAAWSVSECKTKTNCQTFPISMRFDFVTNSKVKNLQSINSRHAHFEIYGCEKIRIIGIRISAPADSPNTDGIKIGASKKIRITHSTIGTGDDCVAILSGCRSIEISDVKCGPGHGISVGSLAKYKNEKDVKGITVKRSSFNGTTNGLRIKSWASPYAIKASKLTFEDIVMQDVLNPIIIDQQYCPHCAEKIGASSHVEISNVIYKNIRGSYSSKEAVTFLCSRSTPCRNITMAGIDLHHKDGRNPAWTCSHVNGIFFEHQTPVSC